MKKGISCIIPTKDRALMVEKAIRSVLNQKSVFPIEIVMVDDGSSDNTVEIISREFPDVIIVKTKNAGPGKARNLGAMQSSSDILMFLDSDDEWLPDHAEALFSLIGKGHEFAYGITLNKNEVSGGEFFIPDDGKGCSGDCFRKMARWCFTVPSSVAVTRAAFEALGGFPEIFRGEDWAFFLKFASEFSFGFCEKIITIRKLHTNSLCSASNLSSEIEGMLSTIKNILKNSGRHDSIMLDFFDQAIAITRKEGKSWKTFQDFFTATRNLEPLP